jgi:hypothetical protein
MNFQEPEYLLNEPWWTTVIGCVTLAGMIAFALIAVWGARHAGSALVPLPVNMSKKLFSDLTFGTRFTFYGKTYVKIALNMAEDENRHGHIFMSELQVELIEWDEWTGEPETT